MFNLSLSILKSIRKNSDNMLDVPPTWRNDVSKKSGMGESDWSVYCQSRKMAKIGEIRSLRFSYPKLREQLKLSARSDRLEILTQYSQ